MGWDLPTQAQPYQQQVDWVSVADITPEEWLAWTGLTQYSGLFSHAVVNEGLVYLKSYTGNWFQICGVRVTDEVLIDHQPRLQEVGNAG